MTRIVDPALLDNFVDIIFGLDAVECIFTEDTRLEDLFYADGPETLNGTLAKIKKRYGLRPEKKDWMLFDLIDWLKAHGARPV